ncbi:Lrp/AsnC ligand binding domain-containing protein [Candidatus Lokiarchaeum ossiferum]|uniref:Lrp/AsnC ligand binding domain-containing protein n=1 Tax=Candidatus Lokiarchaeum ossiferum TaxID=2951803 RepID=UPI00352F0F7B
MENNLNQLLLVEELFKNSLLSVNHLAKILPMARQTITKLKQDLWNKRIIHSATYILNPNKVELCHYFIELTGNPTNSEILKLFLPIPEIISLDLILGDYSLLIQVRVYSEKRFREVLALIDHAVTNRIFTAYRIFRPLEFYKLGGFILNRTTDIFPIDHNQWNDLQLLRKNCSLRHWVDRKDDNPVFTKEEKEKMESSRMKKNRESFFNKGIIRAFSITLAKPSPDFAYKYFLRLKPKKYRDLSEIAKSLSHNPHVVDLFRIDAESCIFATFRVKGLYQLKEFIFSLYQIYHIDKTYTTLVMQEIIPTIHPPSIKVAKLLSSS